MLTQYTRLLDDLYRKLRRGQYKGLNKVMLVHGVYNPRPGVYRELLSWGKQEDKQADVELQQHGEHVYVGKYLISIEQVYDISDGVWVKKPMEDVKDYIEGLIQQTKSLINN